MSTTSTLDAAHPSTSVAGKPRGLTVRPPQLRDPRLHVAAVLLTVQVLGQTVIDWDLSVAQILVALGSAAAVELAMTVPGSGVVAWPASALLTGNGVALITRVPGTEHGDWLSTRGWYVFAATAALSVLSKYVIRVGNRPLFNPSNLGLVLTFLILGSGIADPQDLWWGQPSVGLTVTYAVIAVGGLVITTRLGLLRISLIFWSVFASLTGIAAALGHDITARWSLGPVSGWTYWSTVTLSPEVLIFLFFMITDPRTVARGRRGAELYAIAVATIGALLVSMQTTEFATKVALLTALVIVCGLRPAIEACGDRPGRIAMVALPVVSVTVVLLAAPRQASLDPTAPLPAVELAAGRVGLGDGFDSLGGSFTLADARRVAERTAGALLTVDRALAQGDTAALRRVTAGPYRETVVRAAASRPEAPVRTFDSARLDVVRERAEFQAQPRLLVHLTGTLDGRRWSGDYHVAATTADVHIEREV